MNATSFKLPPLPYQTHCGQYDLDNSPNSTVNTCEKNCPSPQGECECINVIPMASHAVFEEDSAEGNLESIIMVFSAIASFDASHPIHMHGHAFQVVYIGYGTYDENGMLTESTTDLTCDTPCTNPSWENGVPQGVLDRVVGGRVTTNAIQKDTVVIPAGGYVVIAINADNPGYWYIHCHIEGHTEGGMIALLQEYPANQHRAPPPGINDPGDFTWSIEE